MSKILKRLALALGVLLMAACASVPPTPEEAALRASPSAAEVQKNPEAFAGKRVRWGGSVIAVENLKDVTHIELLTRGLTSSGKVDEASATRGRGLVRVTGFVEPAEYPVGRLLTVVGTVDRVVEKPVGEYAYPYVVIDMESLRLWQAPPVLAPGYRSYFPYYLHHDDVFYDPYGDLIFSPFYRSHRHPFY